MSMKYWLISILPVVLVGVGVWLWIIVPIADQRQLARSEFEKLSSEIENMSVRLMQLQSDTRKPDIQDEYIWFSSSPTEVASQLQRDVVNISETAGVELTRFSSETSEGDLYPVAIVNLEGHASITELSNFLASIKKQTPVIAIENLTVRNVGNSNAAQEPRQWVRLRLRALVRMEE